MNNNIVKFTKQDLISLEMHLQTLLKKGEINYPQNYSISNALKSCWFALQDNPSLLSNCSKNSIYLTLFKTIILGLTPAKKQVYFIPYGNKLTAFISYFGILAILKRIPSIIDVRTEIIYKDDLFEYEIESGLKKIKKHIQKFDNIKPNLNEIRGSYCIIVYLNRLKEKETYIEIMNTEQIKRAWNKSKVKENEVHKTFPEEMIKRTIIMRAAKKFINASDDSDLILNNEFWKTIEEEYSDNTETEQATIEIDIPEQDNNNNNNNVIIVDNENTPKKQKKEKEKEKKDIELNNNNNNNNASDEDTKLQKIFGD